MAVFNVVFGTTARVHFLVYKLKSFIRGIIEKPFCWSTATTKQGSLKD